MTELEGFQIQPIKLQIKPKPDLFLFGEVADSPARRAMEEVYLKYGPALGSYLAGRGEYVVNEKKFDVDQDHESELILEVASWGQNHPPGDGYIVKNNTIIVSMFLRSGSIEPAQDGNGFYLKRKLFNGGFCCPSGYRLYRIVYENGTFKPVW